MSSGNVSIRLSLQDVETVRAGLEKLGNDGQAALKKLEVASTAPSHGLSAVDKSVNDLKSRVEDAGRSLGPLGTLLMGLGPIGIAAAAGLAIALGIMYEMSKAANELAERSAGIRNFAEATGTATTQIQALVGEGAKFGLTSEQIAGGLQRLSVNLADAKRGTGALYEDLFRINPELAHQVAGAKGVAEAYDLIGKAIKQASDAQDATRANQIARAAFGRSPGTQGALASDVYGSGGMNALAASYQNAGKALDSGLLKKLEELSVKNKLLEQQIKDINASIFAEDVLTRINRVDEAMLHIAQHTKEMHDATKDESWGQWFGRMGGMIGDLGDEGTIRREQIEQETLESAARRRLQSGMAAGKRSDADLDESWQPAGRGQDDPSGTVKKVGDAAASTAVPIEAVLADTKKWMAVLGSAATPAEQLRLKILELAVATKDHAASAQVSARALQALKDSQTVAAASAREGLGLASQEELITSGLIKLRDDYAKDYIRSAQEMEQAEQRLIRTTQEAFKQEQVANSAFKGLTQMSQGAGVGDIDKLATGMLNNLTTTSVSALNAVNQLGAAYNTLGQHINATTTNTNAAKQAFINFGREAIQQIEQLIFKALILSPLLQAMGLGGGAGGGFSFFKSGSGFAEGGIMTSMGPLPLRRYAGGGVTDRPQLAMFGEGSKPEAYVPLPDGRSIPVSLKGASGGGGHTFHTTVNNELHVPAGTAPEDARKMMGTFVSQARDMVKQVVDEQIVRHLQSGGMLNL